jgi:hypothetical protein
VEIDVLCRMLIDVVDVVNVLVVDIVSTDTEVETNVDDVTVVEVSEVVVDTEAVVLWLISTNRRKNLRVSVLY